MPRIPPAEQEGNLDEIISAFGLRCRRLRRRHLALRLPVNAAPVSKGRAGRAILIALGIGALLLEAAYAALMHAYPPARLAAMLAQQISNETGRGFRIDGDLSFRVLPALAIEAHDIVLANADWGSPTDMVRARRVAFRLSLRDLVAGRLRLLGIDVEGADLWLEGDGAGRFNWQLTGRKPSGSSAASLSALDRVVAADVRITYRDGAWSTAHMVGIESLDLSAEGDGQQLAAGFEIGRQHWKVDGDIGPLSTLLAGTADWPFDLRFATQGATGSAKGSIGTGPRANSIEATASARIESASVLADFVPAAAALPMPLEGGATLHYTPGELQAEAIRLSIAGQTLTGRLTRFADGPQPRIEAQLSAAAIDLSKWLPARPATVPGATARQRPTLFGDAPLPFDALPASSMKIALKVDVLELPGAPRLSAVRTQISTERGRFTADPLDFAVAGGQVRARVDVALRKDAPPRTELRIDAKSLSVDALDAQWGGGRHFESGRANLEARLALVGRTPRSLAASSTGDALLTVHDVTLKGKAATLDRDVVARLLDALIPSSVARQNLVVQCAVVRLPLRNGVAPIDRSVALETQQIAVSASGEVNLAKQTISLAFRPTVRRGLGLNPGNLVELMLLEGPLTAPQLSINPQGFVRQAANVGVAAATGGLSLLAPVLRRDADGSSACAQAARPTSNANPAKAVPPAGGHGLHSLLPRPFGGASGR